MTTLRNEIRILFSTIMFFTLVPVPTFRFSPQHLQKIMRYVSLVGLAIGCVGAAAYWFCAQFVDGTAAPAIAALFATAIVTGAFHEDGFADFCDGLAAKPGPHASSREHIVHRLEVMRQSRLGPAGVLGASLMALLRFAVIATLPVDFAPLAIIVVHGVSRFVSSAYVFDLKYSALPGSKPNVTQMGPGEFFFAGMVAAMALAMLPAAAFATVVLALLAAYVVFRGVLVRKFAGYTGDCLGAAQQVFECVAYLGIGASLRWPVDLF